MADLKSNSDGESFAMSPLPWSGPPSPTGTTWASYTPAEDSVRAHNLDQLRTALLSDQCIFLQGFDLDKFSREIRKGHVKKNTRAALNALPYRRIQAKDGPRFIFDQEGKFVMFYAPQFWGEHEQLEAVRAIKELTKASPLSDDPVDAPAESDKSETIQKRGLQDSRVNIKSKHRGSCSYWNIYHHAPAQHFAQSLNYSKSLRVNGEWEGAEARVEYLRVRQPHDQKINDLLELLNPRLFESLKQARKEFTSRGAGIGDWLDHWHALLPGLAIIKNRETALHRDRNGAQYAGDFLSVFGDFTDGDLHLPDLNSDFEWTGGAACFFDGRTFLHKVKPWEGSLRLCLVSYLWKTSMDALKISLSSHSVTYEQLMNAVNRLQ